MPYEDVMLLRIARPNLLQSTGFGNPPSVSGHSKAQQGYLSTTLDNPPVMNSAGRLHMSIGDWLQTASLHTNSRSFLPQEVRKQLQFSSVDCGYAGGWIVTKRSWAAGPALTHAGSNTFWFAVMWIAPNTGRAFAAVANAAGAEVSNSLDRIIGAMILKTGSTTR
jgi:CubicO group peptidase (beta-lactamase class C family)